MEGEPHLHAVEDPEQESWDEKVIRHGIEMAKAEERPISDRIARYISGQLHDGQFSALYSLASSGCIRDGLEAELEHTTEVLPGFETWVDALRGYAEAREDKGPVEGWAERSAAWDRQEQDDEWIDFLFSETPDEQVGTTDELGWFGLLKSEYAAGGVLICKTTEGFRNVSEIATDQELHAVWSAVQARYAEFYKERGDE